MDFRPCIDIHNGKVKQIVGGTLLDESDTAKENFVSSKDSAYYANLYKEMGLLGGHVIMLNGADSPYYEATRKEAVKALNTYRGGLQIGGGINNKNAQSFIDEGASHVIVTSFVFSNGSFHRDNLELLANAIGKEKIVVDLSCRWKDDAYYIVTDRWQKYTDVKLTADLFRDISECCDEFLVHAVGVEGTGLGIDDKVLEILAASECKVTYAGGISSIDDIEKIKIGGRGNVNFTIGSCLDIFGGNLGIEEVCACIQ